MSGMPTLEALQKNSFGSPYRTTSWYGLSARQLVEQSAACHPEWNVADHAFYLVTEEPFDPAYVVRLPLASWLYAMKATQ